MSDKEETMPEFMQMMEDWRGYNPVRNTPLNEAAMAGALDLLHNVRHLPSHRWEYEMKEAITTSDFPLLMGGILDRELLAKYKMVLPDWKTYAKIGSCRDFRQRELHKIQGNENFLPEVPEKGEYLVAPMASSHYHIQVKKRGRQFDISWEAVINDDLEAFTDLPERFSNAAIYTEAYVATNAFAVAAGPNPLLFGTPIADVDGMNVTNQGVLPLTIANLDITRALIAAQVGTQGVPLSIRGIHLVVPPALEVTGRAILTSAFQQWTEVGAGAGVPMPTTNVLPQMGFQLHVNNMLPVIDTSGNKNGTWYLFADTSEGAAVEFDFLKGHESPEICMKASDKVSITGGPVSPFDGDFATDNVFYRVRHCMGAAQFDPRFAYVQVHT